MAYHHFIMPYQVTTELPPDFFAVNDDVMPSDSPATSQEFEDHLRSPLRSLSKAALNAQETTLFLLGQPELVFEHPDASSVIRRTLRMSSPEWANACKRMETDGILSRSKTDPRQRSYDKFEIEREGLARASHYPYVRGFVADVVREHAIVEFVQSPPDARHIKQLDFRFAVGDSIYRRTYHPNGKNKYVHEPPLVKLLLAIGQAGNFEQTIEQHTKYLERVLNKGLPKDSISLDGTVQEALEAGLIAQRQNGQWELLPAALDTLAPSAAARRERISSI